LLVNIVDRTIFGCDTTIWKSKKKKIKTLWVDAANSCTSMDNSKGHFLKHIFKLGYLQNIFMEHDLYLIS